MFVRVVPCPENQLGKQRSGLTTVEKPIARRILKFETKRYVVMSNPEIGLENNKQ